jgi:hypothetical protein
MLPALSITQTFLDHILLSIRLALADDLDNFVSAKVSFQTHVNNNMSRNHTNDQPPHKCDLDDLEPSMEEGGCGAWDLPFIFLFFFLFFFAFFFNVLS